MWAKASLLHKTESKISGEIIVVKYQDEIKLVVSGYTQSVYMPRGNWEKLKGRVWGKFLSQPEVSKVLSKPCNILLLGLGGATVAHLIQQKYEPHPIEAIELEPKIINIGKKFFGLGELENLNITIGDAYELIKDHKSPISNKKYDFIVADTYIGGTFSHEGDLSEYAMAIKKILCHPGIIVFNIHHNKAAEEIKKRYLAKLDKIFNNIKTVLVSGALDRDNLLAFCYE